MLEALREERRAAFDDLDSLINRAVSREVDKVFVRALILIVLALGGLAAITVLAIRALNRAAD